MITSKWRRNTILDFVNEHGIGSRSQLRRASYSAYLALLRNHKELAYEMFGEPKGGGRRRIWTQESISKLVREYEITKRAELLDFSPGAYFAMRNDYPGLAESLFGEAVNGRPRKQTLARLS